jgi:hypothetical protein
VCRNVIWSQFWIHSIGNAKLADDILLQTSFLKVLRRSNVIRLSITKQTCKPFFEKMFSDRWEHIMYSGDREWLKFEFSQFSFHVYVSLWQLPSPLCPLSRSGLWLFEPELTRNWKCVTFFNTLASDSAVSPISSVSRAPSDGPQSFLACHDLFAILSKR